MIAAGAPQQEQRLPRAGGRWAGCVARQPLMPATADRGAHGQPGVPARGRGARVAGGTAGLANRDDREGDTAVLARTMKPVGATGPEGAPVAARNRA